ncbi:hypothetical protein COV93_04800 [Candidatus Woesearchaeota archaeon CG11_big_fil_rev_8_21_14_0_20_43_8]|nr:MAG: hypothetical protein COV93_04800 [Candidatus Woesearchaeota archaeon CG11_big_fil_rev_8_21_14_0_20_43_8]PIO08931.1 MAG: hypothetical protein COT47_00620 [Candidatus Woesearchaeota archaeon CG08_land_8_20_14_0_20_43_7]
MEFDIEKKEAQNKEKYAEKHIQLAYKFSGKLVKEFGPFIKGIMIFGSTARGSKDADDIDILAIVDDISIVISKEVAEAYRIITEKLIVETTNKLHVTTLKFTTFWEYIRAGDPVGINILREGYPILDTGFITPLQALLVQGRIRPSPESVWNYFSRSPKTLNNAQWHILQGILDLYWAVIDSSHAALMKIGEVPPSPRYASNMLDEKLVKTGHLKPKHVKTMKKFYYLMKKITHKELQVLPGRHFDKLYLEAEEFVKDIRKFLEKKLV